MSKKEDGSFSFKAAPEDFPLKHKGIVINIGIAETGMQAGLKNYLVVTVVLPSGVWHVTNWVSIAFYFELNQLALRGQMQC